VTPVLHKVLVFSSENFASTCRNCEVGCLAVIRTYMHLVTHEVSAQQ
jgi:hypothetical protein